MSECPRCGETLTAKGYCRECSSFANRAVNQKNEIEINFGKCNKCGRRGRKIENEFLCLSCKNKDFSKQRTYESREEAMYFKALFVYYLEPLYLGEITNDNIIGIAYDRFISKKYGVKINQELWEKLPYDVK